MATSIHVNPKGSWKQVKIDYNLLSKGDFDSLISLEELTDYDLIKEGYTKEGKQKKKADVSAKEQDGSKNKQKKKKKKKDKAKLKTENVDLDISDPKVKSGRLVDNETEVVDINTQIHNEDQNQQKKGKKRKKTKADKVKDSSSPVKKTKVEPVTVSEETDETPQESPCEETNRKASLKSDKKNIEKEMILWKDLFVPKEVLIALRDNGFHTPTPIQYQVLPHAIRDRLDIVGAAETGSGKTLAFGIPVIHKILKYKEHAIDKSKQHRSKHLKEFDRKSDEDEMSDNEDETSDNNDNETDDKQKDSSVQSDSDEELEWESDDESLDKSDIENQSDESDEDEMDKNVGSDKDGNEVSDDIEDGGMEDDDDSMGFGCVNVIDNADFSSLGIIEEPPTVTDHPLALILEPTRELAVQVKNHLQTILKYTDIKVAIIVGGMSVQKQQRVLKKCPDILVATPGRLWELFQLGNSYLVNVDKVHSLVIDEADRMVERGHFEELEKLCLHINNSNRDENQRKRQNFVFSATLTMIHIGPSRPTKKKRKKLTSAGKLESLIDKIGLTGKPKVIDLSRKTGTVETLTEARINCSKEEKDLYLYYFLNEFPGRTLVFANSKDCIRRLTSIFTLLKRSPLPLHADMHQKQRLKNLEKFTANPNGLLLASDVAARGLDIPNVQHVIHYQVPLTVENYVHRSGRTARASKEGISVMVVGPEDVKNYRKIIHSLNRNEDLPIIPVEYQLLPPLKQRLSLALTIDVAEHRFDKKKRHNDWFVKAAKEMDMELDDRTHLLNDMGDSLEQTQHKLEVKHLRQELTNVLQQPLTAKGFSGKYPTQTGKLLLPQKENKNSDAITCVKKDKKSQEKLLKRIQKERTRMQINMENKKKAKLAKKQEKKNRKKKNKEKNKES